MALVCCAPSEQRTWRDLAQLEKLCAEVAWLDRPELANAPMPAIVCGLAAHDDPRGMRDLLKKRAGAGYTTVLVPRFRAGDLAGVLEAPAAVMVRNGDATQVRWADGTQFAVSAVTAIDTALHARRWATSNAGCCVLAYRANTGTGAVVICTAVVAGRALGVDPEEQQSLLSRIFEQAAALETAAEATKSQAAKPQADEEIRDLETFLQQYAAEGAALLLTVIIAQGNRGADLATIARERLGMSLPADKLAVMLSRLPETTLAELALTLRNHGWGAHLRQTLAAQGDGGTT
jgi:hypothetical protein